MNKKLLNIYKFAVSKLTETRTAVKLYEEKVWCHPVKPIDKNRWINDWDWNDLVYYRWVEQWYKNIVEAIEKEVAE